MHGGKLVKAHFHLKCNRTEFSAGSDKREFASFALAGQPSTAPADGSKACSWTHAE